MPPNSPSARFPTTAWNCVHAAQESSQPEVVACALSQLMTNYWKPVFYFLRAEGYPHEDAEDLTQEFFARLQEKDWIRSADSSRGKFRTFLLTLLQRFACDRTGRATRQKKFERKFIPLAQDYNPPAGEKPEDAYFKQWKVDLLARVRRSLRAYYEGLNKPDELRRYEIFAAVHFVEHQEDQPTQEALAAQFGITRDQVRYALQEVQKRYKRFFSLELLDEGFSEDELDDEIRSFL